MRPDQIIDIIQTAAIITVSAGQIYALWLLRKAFGSAKSEQEILAAIDRIWKRLEEIEVRQGVRGDIDPIRRFMKLSDALARALRDEERQPPPPSP